MPLDRDTVSYVQEAINKNGQLITIAGAVVAIDPFQVVWDGSSGPVTSLIRSDYAPKIGDRVFGIKVGNSVICNGAFKAADNAFKYTGQFSGANPLSDRGTSNAWDQIPLVQTLEGDDGSWVVSNDGFSLEATERAYGFWVADASMRFSTSAASSSTSWRYLAVVHEHNDFAGPTPFIERVAVGQTQGHLSGGEQNIAAVGSPFFARYDNDYGYGLTISKIRLAVNASTASNTVFAQTWGGAPELGSNPATRPATFVRLRRVGYR